MNCSETPLNEVSPFSNNIKVATEGESSTRVVSTDYIDDCRKDEYKQK